MFFDIIGVDNNTLSVLAILRHHLPFPIGHAKAISLTNIEQAKLPPGQTAHYVTEDSFPIGNIYTP